MNNQEAIKLLNETFNKEFNLGKFTNFLSELFNGFYPQPKSIGIHKEYEQHIVSISKLGNYKQDNKSMEIMVVKLKKGNSLDRARTMQRNVIAKLLKNFNIDSSLVAFTSEGSLDWRFSFVKMDYKLTEDGKVSEELTPAKRYSFLVGPNEPNHTCRSQFIELIKTESHKPSVDEIENAFSIERVTKEFFEKYKNLYYNLKNNLDKLVKKDKNLSEEFEDKQISTIDFSKKLLGQIVFLYFLQKKGWLGVRRGEKGKFEQWGEGSRRFIQDLFYKSQKEKKNFFNDYLEHLFYSALATDRRPEDLFRLDGIDYRIPFLNGGLFEPINEYKWAETDILLPNELFSNLDNNGIFDVFDEFNFTIKEDEPLEKEVAVDPEMLGKVFENLLDVEDRKSKGAFYTPREIVHYMCQQSIINYLETNTPIPRKDLEFFIQKGDLALEYLKRQEVGRGVKEEFVLPDSIKKDAKQLNKLLVEIKICDPAVGSGAFPVGMMNEIIKARTILSYILKQPKTDYELKRETIENSLYGVDIEPSAVEITKLRFWLSLIVDEEDMNNIKPLPNLENKIMCGNSLIEEFEGIKLYIDPSDIKASKDTQSTLDQAISKKVKRSEQKLKELRQKQKEFFDVENRTQKNKLRNEVDKIEWEFIEETLREQGDGENMKKLEEYKKNKSKPFFLWKLYFNDAFFDERGKPRENPGFDVVIANPPYIRDEEIMELKESLKRSYSTFTGNSDIYTYFYEKGISILKGRGVLTYISSNKFMRAKYGLKIRNFIKENTSIKEIINFESIHLFEAVTNTLILILKKEVKEDNIFILKNNLMAESIEFNQIDLMEEAWSIFDKQTMKIKKKIEYMGEPLSKWNVKINYGLISGFNEAFVIDKDARNKLINISPQNEKIIKPLVRGRDIGRYYHQLKDKYLIVIPSGWTRKNYNKENLTETEAKRFIDKRFPGITDHMEKVHELFQSGEIKAKGKGLYTRDNKGEYWWELRDCTYYNDFKKKKIIWIELSDKNKFTYSDDEEYILAGGFLMTGEALKYLLGVLNSNPCLFYFNLICNSSGMDTTQWKKFVMERIPVPKISPTDQKPFIEIVDKILDITKDEDYLKNPEKQAKVKAYEKRIDQMVYGLYELTKEEIKIVEESLK